MRIVKRLKGFVCAPFTLASAAVLAVVVPAKAMAQQTMGTIAEDLGSQFGLVGQALVIIAGVIGVVMMIAGLLKLKQAADTNGQQVKYGEGLWRLVVGVGLIAILAFTGVGAATLGLDTDASLGGLDSGIR